MLRQKDGYPWRFAAFLMAYYVTNAVYQGYAAKYFQATGMSYLQMSALLAAMPLTSIALQPLWGLMGDRAKSRNGVLRLLIACSALMVALYAVSKSFWWLLPMCVLFSGFYTAIQPMGDSIILEDLYKHQKPFGPMRLAGCLAFAFANLGLGLILQDRLILVLPLTAGLLSITFATTYWLPATAGHQSTGRRMSLRELFRMEDMAGLLILLMLLQLTMGYFYSFFSVHFTSLPGGTMGLLGACYFLSAVSEVPFLLNADRLFDKLGVGKLLISSAAVLTVRWLILALSHNAYVALASQLLHGWGFIVMTVSMSKFVNQAVPDELKASGQMLLAVVGFGIARAFGILVGGLLSDALGGIGPGYFFCAAVTGLGLIVFGPKYLFRPAITGK